MKTLWIARHAEAASHPRDSMRPLTLRGKQQALSTGNALFRESPSDLHVICSAAKRTVETLAQWTSRSDWPGSTDLHADLYLANCKILLQHIFRPHPLFIEATSWIGTWRNCPNCTQHKILE